MTDHLWEDLMRRLTLSSAVAIAAMLLQLTGCAAHSKSERYYLISNNLKLQYWKTVNEGFAKAATEYGVTADLRGPDTYDVPAELTELRNVIASKPAGILISAADAASFRTDINNAVQANIPVITVDSDAPTSQRLYFIGTNNLQAGHLGGQRMVDKLRGKGNVVFFTNAGQPNLEERLKGYNEIFADHPEIKVVDVFDIKGSADAAFDQTEKYLAKTGADKITGFICLEASAGKNVAEVLKRHNATDRTLIAMDLDADMINLIKGGQMEASVSQKPYTMGYIGLKALADIHAHLPKPFLNNYQVNVFAPYPAFVDTGTALVDQSNADLYSASAEQVGK